MNAENYYHSDTEYKGKEVSNQPCGREEKKITEAKQKLLQLHENIMKSLFSTPAFSCLALI